jgi:hypothetical protein
MAAKRFRNATNELSDENVGNTSSFWTHAPFQVKFMLSVMLQLNSFPCKWDRPYLPLSMHCMTPAKNYLYLRPL